MDKNPEGRQKKCRIRTVKKQQLLANSVTLDFVLIVFPDFIADCL